MGNSDGGNECREIVLPVVDVLSGIDHFGEGGLAIVGDEVVVRQRVETWAVVAKLNCQHWILD